MPTEKKTLFATIPLSRNRLLHIYEFIPAKKLKQLINLCEEREISNEDLDVLVGYEVSIEEK